MIPDPSPSLPDLSATLDALRSGSLGRHAVQDLNDRSWHEARHGSSSTAFLRVHPQPDARDLRPDTPLMGLAFSVKDLFDEQGEVTTAGSTVLRDRPPAAADCPAVARLKAAGGVSLGRTHMVEFAFSGVGLNPHHPTPAARDACSAGPGGYGSTACVPGGSSSGAAVSVASGAAWLGLASDTGGSIRIPAAFNGLVGFKCTASRVPTEGSIPLSSTLDTVGAITRSVRDAVLAHEILAGRRVQAQPRPWADRRLGIPRSVVLEGLEPGVAHHFQRALRRLSATGATLVELDLPELAELADLQSTGGFSAAESYAWHRDLLARHHDQYDPRVAQRILRGESMRAWEYLQLHRLRRDWIGRVTRRMHGLDALVSPTVAVTAPPVADVAPGPERDEAFFRLNAVLLRNTSVVNMLDGCAITLPCHAPGDKPVGLMLWQGADRDDELLALALQTEALGLQQD